MTGPPERTCVGCREVGDKSLLLRVRRSPDGEIAFDPSGTAPGRGAYVHPTAGCIEAAIRKGALAKALRTGIGPDELGRLGDTMRQGAP
jgi:predicted RNA-binding protein YlxR (DUF448 family)